jgi:hypothetical protein
MAYPIRRSILTHFRIAICCLAVFAGSAIAQHAGRVMPPMPVPPVNHAPAYHAPVYQPPVYRVPSYSPGISAPSIARPNNPIGVRPPYFPVRPPAFRFYTFPVVSSPFWQPNFCWWATCNPLWMSTFIYNAAPLTQWNPPNYVEQPPPARVYIYGGERPDYPQLFLKDGSVLYVTDYWLVDGQLHFMLMEQEGVKPTEEIISFDELDLQKTSDIDTQRGFRFMLRNEPFEQYVRDHPEGPPSNAINPQ